LAGAVTRDPSGQTQDARMRRPILFPLPDHDFDVTEVAVPWKLLTEAGWTVVFATEEGATPVADPLLLSGVIFGKLGARPEAIRFYRELETDAAFRAPKRWRDVNPADYAGIFLAGGHAPGMRQYLDSTLVQQMIVELFKLDRPVAAICHGVLPLARAIDPATGHSVLHGRRTTCLPRYMERAAYVVTFWKLGRYYRTYPAYVETEVRAALADPSHFERGPRTFNARGTRDDDAPAFIVEDGNYLSARWPGDAYLLARRFLARLDAARDVSAGAA
jgi:putative intracellular protease/amidase